MLSKEDLRSAIASKNRGISATASDRQRIASIIAHVEDLNPTPDPIARADLLAGNWRLLYTTSQELLKINQVPLVRLGEIYQCVRPETSCIYNIAEIKSLPYVEGLVSVVASFQSVAADDFERDGQNMADAVAIARRVNVRFNRAVFGLQRTLGYRSVSQYVEKLESTKKINPLQGLDFPIDSNRQAGWLDITYLDEDLRIGRGNQGSVFILTK